MKLALRTVVPLRLIYTVQLCRMRYAYDKSTTRVVSCKSNLQLACDCRVRHGECRGLLKHVLKPYDNRSDRQFDIVESVYDFSMTGAAWAIKIACDSCKQKSYRVNRPLYTLPWQLSYQHLSNLHLSHTMKFVKRFLIINYEHP